MPEHPEIFARWQREAAAYRAAARDAELGLSYGPSPRQTIDLFPAKDDDDMTPLALFIHGGWWRSLEPAMFSQMAAGPNARGLTVAVAGYDLCPQVSIATIIEQMRAACLWLWRKHRKRIFVYGHSAGGHLAACLLAQDWKAFASDAPADLVPAAYAISGVFDLAPLTQVSQNQDLRLDEAEAQARVAAALESARRPHASTPWWARWSRANSCARAGLSSTAGARAASRRVMKKSPAINHFTMVDALSDPTAR